MSCFRPRTRGELVRALHAGTACEVVTDNVETTCMMLDGWLKPPPYTVRPSKSDGWSIFQPLPPVPSLENGDKIHPK